MRSNDIALLRLMTKAILTDNVNTICIPLGRNETVESLDEIDRILIIAGWGNMGKNTKSDELRYGLVPYVDNDKCIASYEALGRLAGKNVTITENHMVTWKSPNELIQARYKPLVSMITVRWWWMGRCLWRWQWRSHDMLNWSTTVSSRSRFLRK